MSDKQDQVKIQFNVPELIEFRYNEPKVGTGQYGEWYCYGVVNRGVDKVFFPTKYLNDKLKAFAPLQGKTLEIVKTEGEEKSVVWLVNLPGSTNVPNQPENLTTVPNIAKNDHSDCEMTFAKMRVAFRELEKRVEAMETLTEPLTTDDAKRLHQSLANTSKTIETAASILGGEVDDDGLPRKS